MYRVVSAILLLIGVLAAVASSVMFYSSKDFAHLKVALSLWFGVAWYFGFRRKRAMKSSDSYSELQSDSDGNGDKAFDFSITLPVAIGTLFVLLGPYFLFKMIGWDERPGINFLAACFGGMGAFIFLSLVVVFRSFRKTK